MKLEKTVSFICVGINASTGINPHEVFTEPCKQCGGVLEQHHFEDGRHQIISPSFRTIYGPFCKEFCYKKYKKVNETE